MKKKKKKEFSIKVTRYLKSSFLPQKLLFFKLDLTIGNKWFYNFFFRQSDKKWMLYLDDKELWQMDERIKNILNLYRTSEEQDLISLDEPQVCQVN
jgi:hypothetical protein